MMRPTKRLVLMVICLVSLGAVSPVWGVEKIPINYEHPGRLELAQLQRADLEVTEVYGEVIAINATELRLHTANGTIAGQLTPETRIYCNGAGASWEALLPVTPEAFFEARVIVKRGRVLAVDGYYYGEEVSIQGWEYEDGQLKLKLFSLCRETLQSYWLNARARLPRHHAWLKLDQNVFVLHGVDGTIRAVYD